MSNVRLVYRCPRIPETSGGTPAPSVWQAIPFAQLLEATTGAAPRQTTRFRMAWNSAYLLARFEATDSHIRATMRQHDDPLWLEEVVELFLDPWGFGRTYFEIEVNPLGTTFDALVLNRRRPGGSRDLSTLTQWTCEGLIARVEVDGEVESEIRSEVGGAAAGRGWTVDLAIPIAQLAPPVTPSSGVRWHFNACRIDRSPHGDELQAFSPPGRADFHVPERFAVLEFE